MWCIQFAMNLKLQMICERSGLVIVFWGHKWHQDRRKTETGPWFMMCPDRLGSTTSDAGFYGKKRTNADVNEKPPNTFRKAWKWSFHRPRSQCSKHVNFQTRGFTTQLRLLQALTISHVVRTSRLAILLTFLSLQPLDLVVSRHQ